MYIFPVSSISKFVQILRLTTSQVLQHYLLLRLPSPRVEHGSKQPVGLMKFLLIVSIQSVLSIEHIISLCIDSVNNLYPPLGGWALLHPLGLCRRTGIMVISHYRFCYHGLLQFYPDKQNESLLRSSSSCLSLLLVLEQTLCPKQGMSDEIPLEFI